MRGPRKRIVRQKQVARLRRKRDVADGVGDPNSRRDECDAPVIELERQEKRVAPGIGRVAVVSDQAREGRAFSGESCLVEVEVRLPALVSHEETRQHQDVERSDYGHDGDAPEGDQKEQAEQEVRPEHAVVAVGNVEREGDKRHHPEVDNVEERLARRDRW